MRLPDGIGDEAPDRPASALIPSGLISGIHIWPGFWVGAGYGRLLHILGRRNWQRVVPFPYDWRLSNRLTAQRLRATVEAALGRWRELPGQRDAMVIFVCHSMGGLIARYYLDNLGGAEIARRLITVGTPYSGSIKAIRALSGGLLPLGRLDRALVDVARTFPSVHQLLPTYHCVNLTGHDPVTIARGLADLPSVAISDGLAFHQELAEARGGPPPYEEHFFGGKRQPTDQSVTPTPRGLEYQRSQRGTDYEGDGTVPYFSSIPAEAVSSGVAVYSAIRHSRLSVDKRLLDLVLDKVDAVDHGAILAPSHELSLDLPEVVTAGTPAPLEIRTDHSDLLLHAYVTGLNGAVHDHHIPVDPVGDGTYAATLDLPPGTWHVDVQTVNDPVPAQIGDVIVVTPPTE